MTVKSEDVEILDDETDDRIDILNHKQELVLVFLGIYASLNLIDPILGGISLFSLFSALFCFWLAFSIYRDKDNMKMSTSETGNGSQILFWVVMIIIFLVLFFLFFLTTSW